MDDIFENISNDIELENNWITEFEDIDKDYDNFYKEDLKIIKIHYIYINDENIIEKIKEEKMKLITPNYISKENLIGILKKNIFNDNKKYNLMSILKYNIDIEPEDINYFLKPKNDGYSFLTPIKNIDEIMFNKSIKIFHDLNNLLIFFYIKSKQNNNYTKKIKINTTHKKTIKTFSH